MLERVVWIVAVGAGMWLVGSGLVKTFYFEGTEEALAEARVGVTQIYLGSTGLLLAAAYGAWRGAPWWAMLLVALLPVLCGGLTLVAGDSLFPQLAFLGTTPFAASGALAGLLRRWRRAAPSDRRLSNEPE